METAEDLWVVKAEEEWAAAESEQAGSAYALRVVTKSHIVEENRARRRPVRNVRRE